MFREYMHDIRVIFDERLEYLNVAGDLLTVSFDAGGLLDVVGNKLVATSLLPLMHHLASTHRREFNECWREVSLNSRQLKHCSRTLEESELKLIRPLLILAILFIFVLTTSILRIPFRFLEASEQSVLSTLNIVLILVMTTVPI